MKEFCELTKIVEFDKTQEKFVFTISKLGKKDRELFNADYYIKIDYYDSVTNRLKDVPKGSYIEDGMDDCFFDREVFEDVDNNMVAILDEIYKECVKEIKRIDTKELDVFKKCMYDYFLGENVYLFSDDCMQTKKEDRTKYKYNYSVTTKKFRYKKLLKILGIEAMPQKRYELDQAIINFIDSKTDHVIPKKWYKINTYRELVIMPPEDNICIEIKGNILEYIEYVNKSKKFFDAVDGTNLIDYCVLRVKFKEKKYTRYLYGLNAEEDKDFDRIIMFMNLDNYNGSITQLYNLRKGINKNHKESLKEGQYPMLDIIQNTIISDK